MVLEPPGHLGEVKALFAVAEADIDAGLIEQVRMWMSDAGCNSIFPTSWPGPDELANHELYIGLGTIREVDRRFGHHVSLRTSWTSRLSPVSVGNDVERLQEWTLAALGDIDRELEERLASAGRTHTQAIAIGIELFVASALAALREENSELRAELDAARIRVGFLEGQLHALTEAQASGRQKITKAILGGVAAILLAAAGGAAEGLVAMASTRSRAESTAVSLARECLRLHDEVSPTENIAAYQTSTRTSE